MWITRRIGKNDGTKNSPFRAAFFKNVQKAEQHWQIQVFCKRISTQNEI